MSNKITKQLLEDIVKNVVKDTIKEELKPIKLLVYSLLKEQVSSKKNKQELTASVYSSYPTIKKQFEKKRSF